MICFGSHNIDLKLILILSLVVIVICDPGRNLTCDKIKDVIVMSRNRTDGKAVFEYVEESDYLLADSRLWAPPHWQSEGAPLVFQTRNMLLGLEHGIMINLTNGQAITLQLPRDERYTSLESINAEHSLFTIAPDKIVLYYNRQLWHFDRKNQSFVKSISIKTPPKETYQIVEIMGRMCAIQELTPVVYGNSTILLHWYNTQHDAWEHDIRHTARDLEFGFRRAYVLNNELILLTKFYCLVFEVGNDLKLIRTLKPSGKERGQLYDFAAFADKYYLIVGEYGGLFSIEVLLKSDMTMSKKRFDGNLPEREQTSSAIDTTQSNLPEREQTSSAIDTTRKSPSSNTSRTSITNTSVSPQTISGCAPIFVVLTKAAKGTDLIDTSKASVIARCKAVALSLGCAACQFSVLNLQETYIPLLIEGTSSRRGKRQSPKTEDLENALTKSFDTTPHTIDLNGKPFKADIVGGKLVGRPNKDKNQDSTVVIVIIVCSTILGLAVLMLAAFWMWTKRGSPVEKTEVSTNAEVKPKLAKNKTGKSQTISEPTPKISAKVKDSTTISSDKETPKHGTEDQTVGTTCTTEQDKTYIKLKVVPKEVVFVTTTTTTNADTTDDVNGAEEQEQSSGRPSKTLETESETSTGISGSKNMSSMKQLFTQKEYQTVKPLDTKYQSVAETNKSGSMSKSLTKETFASNSAYDSIEPGGFIKLHKKKN